jgi:hypothetical protein
LPHPSKPLNSLFYFRGKSLITWPAWGRVLAVLPALLLLWLAVAWAGLEIAPW